MQDRVDAFALAAEDWHGAHNDVERAARGPFGVTVGHAHLHHPVAWSQGGETNRDGMLICAPHHTRIHDTSYRYTQLPNGRIAFHRRT